MYIFTWMNTRMSILEYILTKCNAWKYSDTIPSPSLEKKEIKLDEFNERAIVRFGTEESWPRTESTIEVRSKMRKKKRERNGSRWMAKRQRRNATATLASDRQKVSNERHASAFSASFSANNVANTLVLAACSWHLGIVKTIMSRN